MHQRIANFDSNRLWYLNKVLRDKRTTLIENRFTRVIGMSSVVGRVQSTCNHDEPAYWILGFSSYRLDSKGSLSDLVSTENLGYIKFLKNS